MLRAIIFDFDGVVVDSEPVHYAAIRDVAATQGIELSYDRYLRDLIGYDDRDAFRHLLSEAGKVVTDSAVAALKDAKQVAFEALAGRGVPMIPGTRALIEEAVSLRWPIAIASGATRADIDLILGGLGLAPHFPVIVTADDVAASKPHPQTYALAAERLRQRHPDLNLQRNQYLAIEDTAAGIASASGAGLKTLALETTSPRDHLRDADRIVKDLDGVTAGQLRQWYG